MQREQVRARGARGRVGRTRDAPSARRGPATSPPHRFVELAFVGVNPAEPTTLVWHVDQTYRGGVTERKS